MKKVLLALTILLSGCTAIDAYMMTKYDNNEYSQITAIRSQARLFKTQCNDAVVSKSNADKLANATQLFSMFSEHIPHNKEMSSASKSLDVIAQGLSAQYKNDKVSPVFCKIKFENIETSAEKMQTVIGGRPR
jgi:hypothetical protein